MPLPQSQCSCYAPVGLDHGGYVYITKNVITRRRLCMQRPTLLVLCRQWGSHSGRQRRLPKDFVRGLSSERRSVSHPRFRMASENVGSFHKCKCCFPEPWKSSSPQYTIHIYTFA